MLASCEGRIHLPREISSDAIGREHEIRYSAAEAIKNHVKRAKQPTSQLFDA
jgi:hypothetical protein